MIWRRTIAHLRTVIDAHALGPKSQGHVEFRLLRYFMLNPGKPLSKARLQEHVYGGDSDPDSNVLEVYVNRLRRKLGQDLITTRRGQGYVFGQSP